MDKTAADLQKEAINEPFICGRESSRLLFDFAIRISCIKGDNKEKST
jgi:hypothetical protein